MATTAQRSTSGAPAAPESRGVGVLLLVCGAIGLAAAFVLAVERFKLLDNPLYVPSCDLGAEVSCLAVMTSDQASAFGFPNPFLGLVGFAVVVATGAMVLAGGRPAGWYWIGLLLGLTAALVFVHWLAFQTLYRIGALCPYCIAVWVVTIVAWWYVLLRAAGDRAASVRRMHSVVPTVWVLVIAALVYERFWAPWS